MNINLTDNAIKWFQEDFPLAEGEGIRFFGKAYGKTEVHEGFSVGMKLANPDHFDLLAKYEENGRTYFTAKEDEWFFSGYDFQVDFDLDAEVPLYQFKKKS